MRIKKYVFGPHAPEAPYADLKDTKYAGIAPNAGEPGVVFFDGTKVLGELFLSQLSESIMTRLTVHAISQKVGDSYAGAGSEENPEKAATEAITATIGQLLAGDWRTVSVAGPKAGLLAKAVSRVLGVDLEDAVIFVENLDDAAKKAIRADAAVKAATAAIKLEEQEAAKAKLVAAAKADTGGSKLADIFSASMKQG